MIPSHNSPRDRYDGRTWDLPVTQKTQIHIDKKYEKNISHLAVWTLTGCCLACWTASPPYLSGERGGWSSTTSRLLRDRGDEDVLSPGDLNQLPGNRQVLPQV